jgi:uncharacterized protein YndB with AHSA1/START domain
VAITTISTDQDAILTEIYIAAPPERVFQALVDPDQVLQWWGEARLVPHHGVEGRFASGRQVVERGRGDGHSFRVDGEYLEVDPPRLLVHTWISS